jgi:hypothetical protein
MRVRIPPPASFRISNLRYYRSIFPESMFFHGALSVQSRFEFLS